MKTIGRQTRIKPEYTEEIEVPYSFRQYLWDHPNGRAPLEKVIYRLLVYPSFAGIKWLMTNYPDETFKLANKYPDIPRGARFWVKNLYNEK